MVDSSAVMGHDALQRPSWPHSNRRASHRQHDGSPRSKTTGDVKDVAFRMVHISSCCFLSAPSWLSTGWALLQSLADFPRDFLLPAPSSNCSGCLQKELRYDIRQNISSKRHSSSGRAEGTTGLPRRMVCSGQRQLLQSRSSDDLQFSETRHQFQAEFVRRPFRRGGHSLATGRPPLPKRLLSGRQSKVLQRPRKYDPAATTAGTRGTEVEEGEQPKATDVEPEPEGHDEAQAESEVKKDKRLKSENTKSESLGSNPKAARELARAQLQKGYYQSTPGRNGTRVLHRLGACFMVPGIDYPRYVHLGALMPNQSDFDSICKLCARKGTEVAQGDSDVTQTSSSSEAGQ